jgi:hypothetical protein
MKLYRIIGHAWVGTQQAARDTARSYGYPPGTKWEQVEVPTDKEGLLDFLNRVDACASAGELCDRRNSEAVETVQAFLAGELSLPGLPKLPAPSDTPATAEAGDRCPMCTRTPSAAAKLAAGEDADAIAAWILAAEPWLIEKLFATLAVRVADMRSAAVGADDR